MESIESIAMHFCERYHGIVAWSLRIAHGTVLFLTITRTNSPYIIIYYQFDMRKHHHCSKHVLLQLQILLLRLLEQRMF